MIRNFFKVQLPYGMKGNEEIGWYLFNREQLPLGHTDFDFPTYLKFEKINEDLLKRLFELGCKIILAKEPDNIISIYFYSDETMPINRSNEEHLNDIRWDRYSQILKLICYAMD